MAGPQNPTTQKKTCTALLPPLSAVRMVWAMTGGFSDEDTSINAANKVDARLKNIIERAEKAKKDENDYVLNSIACMEACVRSLDIAYKGRQLNFQENDKLRDVYLESVAESLDFGKKAKDYLKSLPGASIGGAGGITLASLLGATSPAVLWGVTVSLTAVGYIVNVLIVQYTRGRRQILYVEQDYDRNLYYDRYMSQVYRTLTSLYSDLDRIHENVFGQKYPVSSTAPADIVDDLLSGVRPALCKFVHKHMGQKKILPKFWSICEAGTDAARKSCTLWDK